MLVFRGLDELLNILKEAEKEVVKNVQEAVDENIKEVFAASQIRVPKKTEELMKSGRIEHSGSGKNVTASVVYGNSDTDRIGVFYAAAVHEILDAKHDPPTGPKYVEQPLIEQTEKLKKSVEKAAMRTLGKKTL